MNFWTSQRIPELRNKVQNLTVKKSFPQKEFLLSWSSFVEQTTLWNDTRGSKVSISGFIT